MIVAKINSGSILLAEPSLMGDIQFQRSVILVTEYSKNGVVGFIANKPLTYTISEILPETTEEFRIYNGGPVEQDNLYFLHSRPDLIPDSIEVCHGVYWGGDFDVVAKLIIEKKITPNEIKFFLGYTGWDFDQLNDELNSNTWIVKNSEEDIKNLLKDTTDCFWSNSMKSLGGEYQLWANSPENPTYN